MADQLDPALIQQVLALQSNEEDPQMIRMARRQRIVNGLRDNSLAPMQGQMVGKHYVAPSALQGLVNVAGGALAGHQQQGIDKDMQGVSDQRIAGRGAYLDALTAAMRRPKRPPAVGEIPEQGSGNDIGLGY